MNEHPPRNHDPSLLRHLTGMLGSLARADIAAGYFVIRGFDQARRVHRGREVNIMATTGTKYLVDKRGRKKAVLLGIKEYSRSVSRLEELEDTLELDEAVRTCPELLGTGGTGGP